MSKQTKNVAIDRKRSKMNLKDSVLIEKYITVHCKLKKMSYIQKCIYNSNFLMYVFITSSQGFSLGATSNAMLRK